MLCSFPLWFITSACRLCDSVFFLSLFIIFVLPNDLPTSRFTLFVFRNFLLPLLDWSYDQRRWKSFSRLAHRNNQREMNNDVKVIKSALSDRFSKNGQAPRGRAGSGLKNRASANYSQREIEMSRRVFPLFDRWKRGEKEDRSFSRIKRREWQT